MAAVCVQLYFEVQEESKTFEELNSNKHQKFHCVTPPLWTSLVQIPDTHDDFKLRIVQRAHGLQQVLLWSCCSLATHSEPKHTDTGTDVSLHAIPARAASLILWYTQSSGWLWLLLKVLCPFVLAWITGGTNVLTVQSTHSSVKHRKIPPVPRDVRTQLIMRFSGIVILFGRLQHSVDKCLYDGW